MNLREVFSPIDGAVHAQNLQILSAWQQSTTGDQMKAACPGVFDNDDVFTSEPSGVTTPRTLFVYNRRQNQVLIVLQGMQNFDKVEVCLTGWSTPLDPVNGTLYPYETAAFLLRTSIPRNIDLSPFVQVRILGHSYGGAVAPYVAKWMQGYGPETIMDVFTYGAPKCAVNMSSLSRRVKQSIKRLFLNADPVPLLPLSSENLASLWLLTGVPTARKWSEWLSPTTGLTIFPSNLIEVQNYPTFQQFFSPIIDLASWATGARAFGSDQHTLNAYIGAIQLTPTINRVNPAPETQPISRGHTIPTTQQLQLQRQEAIVQAGEVIAQNPQQAVIGIIQGVPLVQGERFHGGTSGGNQVVRYNGNIVAWPKTRRLRRALVRQLNRTVALR